MRLKAVVFLKKKASLSRDEFIAYYEHKHVPLVREIFPTISEYRRNFIDHDYNMMGGPADGAPAAEPPPYFDVITEIWFENKQDLQIFIDAHQDAEKMARLQQDELQFLDRSMMQIHAVTEYISPPR